MSTFDKIYRSVMPLKFFSEGWGPPDTLIKLIENMKIVTNRDKFCSVNIRTDIHIDKKTEDKSTIQIEGSFISPFDSVISNALKGDNRIARFQMIIPRKWSTSYRAVCIHFSGTGDQNYYRRRVFLASSLIKDGIASIILMHPFYSKRKPDEQQGSGLNSVSDLFIMGGALIMECSALLKWCEHNGYGPFALHGISMGGYMSALCATVWPKPISLIPCLSWTSASCVFLEGILSNTVNWSVLTKQYYSDSAYSDVIRPQIQPAVPEFCKVTDETSNDTLDDYLQNSPRIPISINSLHSKHSDTVNVAPLATFTKQSDSRLHPIKRHSLKSSLSSFQVRDLLSQFINTSNSASQLSSSHPNTHIFTVAQKFLPSTMYTGFPNFLSSFNFNRVFRFQSNSSRWHKQIPSFPRVSSPSVSFSRTNLSPDLEVRQFLRDLLDYFTHLGNFSPVIDSRLVLSVAAEYDAYVPRGSVCSLKKVYPNGEIRFLPQSGHVGAYVKNSIWTNDFRKAISDCLNQQVQLYHHEPGPFGRINTTRYSRTQ
ncbi:unnamed protein product [Schistosoma rodhaini]|uniref:Protein ABHD18 n=1 Tax=Schistosoma rodhaini TaxID=6188 RepID=A0AA85FS97_9TREM|nr:unnamed protein product [Schistosoma rodhaini]